MLRKYFTKCTRDIMYKKLNVYILYLQISFLSVKENIRLIYKVHRNYYMIYFEFTLRIVTRAFRNIYNIISRIENST